MCSNEIIQYCFFIHYALIHDNDWKYIINHLKHLFYLFLPHFDHIIHSIPCKTLKMNSIDLNFFPKEIHMLILSYFDANSLLKFSVLNKYWLSLCNEESEVLWENICEVSYNIRKTDCNYTGPAKSLYLFMMHLVRSLIFNKQKYPTNIKLSIRM